MGATVVIHGDVSADYGVGTLQLLPAVTSALLHRERSVRDAACSLFAVLCMQEGWAKKGSGANLVDVEGRVVNMVLASGGFQWNVTVVQDGGSAGNDGVTGAQDGINEGGDVQHKQCADLDLTCSALVSAARVSRDVLDQLIRSLPPSSVTNLRLVALVLVALDAQGNGGALVPRRGEVASNCLRWLVRACALGRPTGLPPDSDTLLPDDVDGEVKRATQAIAR